MHNTNFVKESPKTPWGFYEKSIKIDDSNELHI